MKKTRIVAALAVSGFAAMLSGANAQTSQPIEARNVILVHGAWADGYSWAEVIPRLQAAGLHQGRHRPDRPMDTHLHRTAADLDNTIAAAMAPMSMWC